MSSREQEVPAASRLVQHGPAPVFHLLQLRCCCSADQDCSTAHRSSEQFRHFAVSLQSPEGIMERCVRFQPIFVNWL